MKSIIHWVSAEEELPPRDKPILALVTEGHREFVATTHRLSRGWQGIKVPAKVVLWAHLPKPPTIIAE